MVCYYLNLLVLFIITLFSSKDTLIVVVAFKNSALFATIKGRISHTPSGLDNRNCWSKSRTVKQQPRAVENDYSAEEFPILKTNTNRRIARILNSNSKDESQWILLVQALQNVGFDKVLCSTFSSMDKKYVYEYTFSKATGMLQLVSDSFIEEKNKPPKWVPILSDQEHVMVQNGWSFLDVDEVELMSPFDIGAANDAGTYIPKWNLETTKSTEDSFNLSSLGYVLTYDTTVLLQNANQLENELTKKVLLEGHTDPRNRKRTHNGVSFAGSINSALQGIFCTALGDLPLFATWDLSPTTPSSGWLSFVQPIAKDHIIHITNKDNNDDRIEVLCARTRLHLGHYFGRGQGYCINASALNFYPFVLESSPSTTTTNSNLPIGAHPTSWIQLLSSTNNSPSITLLRQLLQNQITTETIAVGAGCFWHVEFALRRLPGIVRTQVGYAGGTLPYPNYEQVCSKLSTGHAEVVLVEFDPDLCPRRMLVDCFLAMHDPTVSRALGKRSKGIGQYRSCIFVTSERMRTIALEAIKDCNVQLSVKSRNNNNNTTSFVALSTDVYFRIDSTGRDGHGWFWRAEDRHQLHDEREKKGTADTSTLSFSTWLKYYGKRPDTIWGSALTELRVMAPDNNHD